MNDNFCVDCKASLDGKAEDKGQAVRIELKFPHCKCEDCCVGEGSPGPISSEENLYRLVISPGDIDQEGNVISTAFRNAYEDGLSMFRELASDEDVSALITERLTRKPSQPVRTVQALLKVKATRVRALDQSPFGRLFCVYDETVPRRDVSLPPVPTHVTVLQRMQPAGNEKRKEHRNNAQASLYKVLCEDRVDLQTFREGLILKLNQAAMSGTFEIKPMFISGGSNEMESGA